MATEASSVSSARLRHEQLKIELLGSDLSDKQRIAIARRILALNGCESGVGGQVSLRHPSSDSFYTTPLQYFEETVPEDVVRLNYELETLEGDSVASGAADFHAAIYLARPDVNAIVHTHGFWTSIVSTTQEPIGRYNYETAWFYNRQGYYNDSADGQIVGGKAIVEALGDNLVLFLGNHGVIVVEETLEQATILAQEIEHCSRIHIEAKAAGGHEMPEEVLARFTYGTRNLEAPGKWNSNYRRVRKIASELFEPPSGQM